MTKTQPIKAEENAIHITRRKVSDFIRKQVLGSLGTPVDLISVQVRPVTLNRYRVNVVVGKHASSARVAHSYFLTTDDEGGILTSSPEIARLY